eukprot:scaffold122099_cov35-Tisochrysis_lutea.AAC.1
MSTATTAWTRLKLPGTARDETWLSTPTTKAPSPSVEASRSHAISVRSLASTCRSTGIACHTAE